MANKVQILRSSVAGKRPATASAEPATPYVNFADKQLGVLDASGAPLDLVAIPFHSATSVYAQGDLVREGADIYECRTANGPKAFDARDWRAITHTRQSLDARYPIRAFDPAAAYQQDDVVLYGSALYRAGSNLAAGAFDATKWFALTPTQVTGADVVVTQNIIVDTSNPTIALDKSAGTEASNIEGKEAGALRWRIVLGNPGPADFLVTRFDDAGVRVDDPISVARATGEMTLSHRLTLPAGTAAQPALKIGAGERGLYEEGGNLALTNLPGQEHWKFNQHMLVAKTGAFVDVVSESTVPGQPNWYTATLGWTTAHGLKTGLTGWHAPGQFADFRIEVATPGGKEYIFDMSGQGRSPGGWTTGSDRRVKEDVQPLPRPLETVNRLVGCSFLRKDFTLYGGERDMKRRVGFIAQEVETVFPAAVTTAPQPIEEKFRDTPDDMEGFKSVDPMPLIGLLVEAVKELSAKVTALEARNP